MDLDAAGQRTSSGQVEWGRGSTQQQAPGVAAENLPAAVAAAEAHHANIGAFPQQHVLAGLSVADTLIELCCPINDIELAVAEHLRYVRGLPGSSRAEAEDIAAQLLAMGLLVQVRKGGSSSSNSNEAAITTAAGGQQGQQQQQQEAAQAQQPPGQPRGGTAQQPAAAAAPQPQQQQQQRVSRDCLRTLRHTFIVCTGYQRGGAGGEPVLFREPLVVEPRFKEQFVIAHPTRQYEELLQVLPVSFVGSPWRLHAAVRILAEQVAIVFLRAGRPLPPWRTAEALLSKWAPAQLQELSRLLLQQSQPEQQRRQQHQQQQQQQPAVVHSTGWQAQVQQNWQALIQGMLMTDTPVAGLQQGLQADVMLPPPALAAGAISTALAAANDPLSDLTPATPLAAAPTTACTSPSVDATNTRVVGSGDDSGGARLPSHAMTGSDGSAAAGATPPSSSGGAAAATGTSVAHALTLSPSSAATSLAALGTQAVALEVVRSMSRQMSATGICGHSVPETAQALQHAQGVSRSLWKVVQSGSAGGVVAGFAPGGLAGVRAAGRSASCTGDGAMAYHHMHAHAALAPQHSHGHPRVAQQQQQQQQQQGTTHAIAAGSRRVRLGGGGRGGGGRGGPGALPHSEPVASLRRVLEPCPEAGDGAGKRGASGSHLQSSLGSSQHLGAVVVGDEEADEAECGASDEAGEEEEEEELCGSQRKQRKHAHAAALLLPPPLAHGGAGPSSSSSSSATHMEASAGVGKACSTVPQAPPQQVHMSAFQDALPPDHALAPPAACASMDAAPAPDTRPSSEAPMVVVVLPGVGDSALTVPGAGLQGGMSGHVGQGAMEACAPLRQAQPQAAAGAQPRQKGCSAALPQHQQQQQQEKIDSNTGSNSGGGGTLQIVRQSSADLRLAAGKLKSRSVRSALAAALHATQQAQQQQQQAQQVPVALHLQGVHSAMSTSSASSAASSAQVGQLPRANMHRNPAAVAAAALQAAAAVAQQHTAVQAAAAAAQQQHRAHAQAQHLGLAGGAVRQPLHAPAPPPQQQLQAQYPHVGHHAGMQHQALMDPNVTVAVGAMSGTGVVRGGMAAAHALQQQQQQGQAPMQHHALVVGMPHHHGQLGAAAAALIGGYPPHLLPAYPPPPQQQQQQRHLHHLSYVFYLPQGGAPVSPHHQQQQPNHPHPHPQQQQQQQQALFQQQQVLAQQLQQQVGGPARQHQAPLPQQQQGGGPFLRLGDAGWAPRITTVKWGAAVGK